MLTVYESVLRSLMGGPSPYWLGGIVVGLTLGVIFSLSIICIGVSIVVSPLRFVLFSNIGTLSFVLVSCTERPNLSADWPVCTIIEKAFRDVAIDHNTER